MNSSEYENHASVALRAVQRACQVCVHVQQKLVSGDTLAKKDRSPVTIADFAAQALILNTLAEWDDSIPCVAEEEADTLSENRELWQTCERVLEPVQPQLYGDRILEAIRLGGYHGGSSGKFWTLDPIDGTKGFLRNEQYAIALGLIENGECVLGVLGCPNLPQNWQRPEQNRGCLFVAQKGGGAFQLPIDAGSFEQEKERIEVCPLQDLSQAAFCESVESGHTRQDISGQIAEQLGIVAEPVRMDSQCKYAAVARGDAAVYLRLPTKPGYQECIWDHAAGKVILEEAGARVGDVDGKPLDFGKGRTLSANRGVIATLPAFFDQVVQATGVQLEKTANRA